MKSRSLVSDKEIVTAGPSHDLLLAEDDQRVGPVESLGGGLKRREHAEFLIGEARKLFATGTTTHWQQVLTDAGFVVSTCQNRLTALPLGR